ncbi:MAG: tetratricopeptide repeat protein [Herminiimonas sp.]|uniref:tetratricopeptide repeat protein n=1 Tax=Herminiimonas sp. TaxID=1926289 RepID=UPI0027165880|nr:tetratricopeptide repeat protein [Herminiimonas sp.]MDO9420802.1 tetratricopeptide repeat protein [Herminiimonas sp.]
MKNALVIVTLSVLLSAGTNLQAQPLAPFKALQPLQLAAKEGQKSAATINQPAGKKAVGDAQEDPLPTLDMSEDLLFKLLRAELAYQRGDWQLAYVTMLVAAQETRDPRLARRAAEIALNVKQTGEALSAVRLWRELAPHSDEANQFYLGLVVLGENLTEAKPIFVERLQEVTPQARGLLILQIQRLLGRTKDKDAAFTLQEELTAPYQGLVETHIALAQAAFAKGDLPRARLEAGKALAIKPDLEIAVLMQAQSAAGREEALQTLSGFLKNYPKSRDVRTAYAKILIDDKQYDEARNQFEILLKDQPKDLTIMYAMGILGAQMNDRDTAEKYLGAYLKELEANPDDERDPVQALLILSQIAEDRKDFPAALKWLAQVEPGPAYFEAQVRSAQIMANTGDLSGARNLLSHLKPEGQREQIQIMVADAQLLRDANRVPEGLAVLAKGLERFPDDTGLLYDYAMLAEKANRFDLMENALRKIIKLAPNNQHAYNALGYSFAERNIHLQEAYTLIDKASKLAPEDPFIMDSMGWIYFRLGKLMEAEDFLRRAYAIRPDVEIGVHLGEVLWIKGEKDAAQQLLRDANQKDPQNDLLKSTLARLKIKL